MRSFLDWAKKNGVIFEQEQEGRSSPIGYLVQVTARKPAIFVCGAYETPTGGCDTIHNVAQVFDMVLEKHQQGKDVLYEGLFCMNMTKGPQLAAKVGKALAVLQLTTPLGTCIESINKRRAERGAGELIKKVNTQDNYRRATNYSAKMRDAGARVIKVTRDEALPKMLELLGC
jgi:hypothetical protein